MTVILFSDQKFEKHVELCIKTLNDKYLIGVKFVYYTIGFDSSISIDNLIKHKIEPNPSYRNFWFYKPHLFLKTIDLYTDDHYMYIDCDVLFSKRFNYELIKHDESYPLCPYGPFPISCVWEYDAIQNKNIEHTHHNLMEYFNIKTESMRYVWACVYSFNNKCKEFFEEMVSILENSFLLKKNIYYFPFGDETALNVCLWKRSAVKNLGHCMLNTHVLNHVKYIEENEARDYSFGENLTNLGEDWQYVYDSKNIILYHGFKELEQMKLTVNYLTKI